LTQKIAAQQHDTILNSINEGVFTVNLDRQITAFNRAAEQITLVKCKDAIGRHCYEIFRADICENACALKRTMVSGKPMITVTTRIYTASGKQVPIRISTAPLKDADGTTVGGVETFQDLSQIEQLQKELESRYTFEDIIGRSSAMVKLFKILPQIAESDSTVLIEGASGTGKELFARAIHNLSTRRKEPFVAVNCGALPDALLESELFGYKAGAFTGARKDKPGRFAIAEKGTIFLDEIAAISPAMQVRLLRVLQDKCFEPLGSVDLIKANVRVIAATNRNLNELVRLGKFRKDLFYRIHVVKLILPDLKQRRIDIPVLVDHMVAKFNRIMGKDISGVSEDVLGRLMRYDYPGNVRELENIIEHGFVLCSSDIIELDHLPAELCPQRSSTQGEFGNDYTLKSIEKLMISEALRRHSGSRKQTARDLGINPSTLYRKIKSLNIETPSIDGRTRQR
jgi:PAS domain S-box-containing protein